MKKEHLKGWGYVLIFISAICIGYKWNQAKKLDAFYLEQLKMVKSRMIFGSPVDSPKELNEYQDQIELCMHLDGYNGVEIMKLRTQAFKSALKENK